MTLAPEKRVAGKQYRAPATPILAAQPQPPDALPEKFPSERRERYHHMHVDKDMQDHIEFC